MNDSEKSALFLVLRALERIEAISEVSQMKAAVLPELSGFLERAWQSLIHPERLKTVAKALYRKISSTALDEQDAGNEGMMFNYYLYAVADLAMFYAEGDPGYLDGSLTFRVEYFRRVGK